MIRAMKAWKKEH